MCFKKKGVGSRNWIALDSNGQAIILDLDKYDIMKRVEINARDLRIIDPLLSYPSAILARGKAIVLNLEVLLRDPFDDDVMPVVEELQKRLPLAMGRGEGGEEEEEEFGSSKFGTIGVEEELPFEIRALEVALEGVCSSLDTQTRELEVDAYPALDELTAKTSSRNLDRVRKMKSAMTRLISRVQKVRDELEQLLDDDDDMADLYLSRKSAMSASVSSGYGCDRWQLVADESPLTTSNMSKSTQDENNVEELEMLLENNERMFFHFSSIFFLFDQLREYIDDTEDYINIQFDCLVLVQLELFLSSGTVCLSMYSLVAAIFGMNIPYPWRESHGHLFKWVIFLTTLASGSVFLWIISYARHKGLVGS
ncbi:Magnesium transporter MRS2-7 [Striga hermonthica]|uniref:Magnesium transporter n=1 Tax=Striga hermonthica TaxID=68872 RepID=A0A9N7R830_STRHE|nr:Magnesium transporter MRS2-7 [Striga hermonthica]